MNTTSFERRQFIHALTPGSSLYFPFGRRAFVRSASSWHGESRSTQSVDCAVSAPFTAILLSYKRPWNIEPLTKMLLRFSSIGRVIVSHNNPSVDLRVHARDPRLTLLMQQKAYPASVMGVLALQAARDGVQRFIAIDDDLLLFPDQISHLLRALDKDASVPHGIAGMRLKSRDGIAFDHHVTGDGTVDVLNRAYAFTGEHALRYGELLDALRYVTDEQKAMLPFGSDIVLSHAGEGLPRIHDVGPLLSCPTAAKPGIARFKEPGFEEFRKSLFVRVRGLTSR